MENKLSLSLSLLHVHSWCQLGQRADTVDVGTNDVIVIKVEARESHQEGDQLRLWPEPRRCATTYTGSVQ